MRLTRFITVLVVLSALFVTTLAYGGSYLDRSALLLADAKRSNDWVLAHLGDKDLALMAREIADARVKAARGMQVPKEVAGVHPHLLLMMENSERAASAAADGDNEKFLHHLRTARDEEATFRGLLAQQKLSLPNVDKR
jgi:hypothetical protein